MAGTRVGDDGGCGRALDGVDGRLRWPGRADGYPGQSGGRHVRLRRLRGDRVAGDAVQRAAADRQPGRVGNPPQSPKDDESPENLQRLVAEIAEKPDNVQHRHTDSAHLESFIAKLKKKPGIHSVHSSGGDMNMALPRTDREIPRLTTSTNSPPDAAAKLEPVAGPIGDGPGCTETNSLRRRAPSLAITIRTAQWPGWTLSADVRARDRKHPTRTQLVASLGDHHKPQNQAE